MFYKVETGNAYAIKLLSLLVNANTFALFLFSLVKFVTLFLLLHRLLHRCTKK